MVNKDTLQRVIGLFATMADTEEAITADSELIDDLGVTSMDVLYLISCLEEEFSVKVPERAIRKMVTIGDVAEVMTASKKK